MKKAFIIVTFLFVCLFAIFLYKKLFLVPAQDLSVGNDVFSAPVLAQNPNQYYDIVLKTNASLAQVPAQESFVLVSEVPKEQEIESDKKQVQESGSAQESDINQDKSQELAPDQEPSLVPAPVAIQVLAQELSSVQKQAQSSAQNQKSAHDLSPAPVLMPAPVLDQDIAPALVQEPDMVRTIRVKNNMTPGMLKYAHWTGTYSPTSFSMNIDGSELGMGQERVIDIKNNRFVVSYQYVFMNGYKKGHRAVTFDVDKDVSMVNLTFSWKTKWHILSEQASPLLVEEVS